MCVCLLRDGHPNALIFSSSSTVITLGITAGRLPIDGCRACHFGQWWWGCKNMSRRESRKQTTNSNKQQQLFVDQTEIDASVSLLNHSHNRTHMPPHTTDTLNHTHTPLTHSLTPLTSLPTRTQQTLIQSAPRACAEPPLCQNNNNKNHVFERKCATTHRVSLTCFSLSLSHSHLRKVGHAISRGSHSTIDGSRAASRAFHW